MSLMPEWLHRRYKLLEENLGSESFSALDVKEVLGDSRSMSYLVIRELRGENLMQKVSQGVYTLRRDKRPFSEPILSGQAAHILARLRERGIHVVMTGTDALGTSWPHTANKGPMLATADRAEWRLLSTMGRQLVPVLLNPSRSELQVVTQLGFQERPLVVRKISTYYAAIRGIARPERALVDVYVEASRYGWVATPKDLGRATSFLFSEHIVNVPMMLAYARYRRVEPEIRHICQNVADEVYPPSLLRGPVDRTPTANEVVESIKQLKRSDRS